MSDDQIWVMWLAEHPEDMEGFAEEGEEYRDLVEGTTAFQLWRLGRQYEHTVAQVPIVGPLLASHWDHVHRGLRRDFAAHNAARLVRALQEQP